MKEGERPWAEAEILAMRPLWDGGVSLAEIGRRLRRSKSSVNAKIDRLGWPGRPSPLHPGGDKVAGGKAVGRRPLAVGLGLPPLPSEGG